MQAWRSFKKGTWSKDINVRDFIQLNYTPYEGDDSFLAGPTQRTTELWNKVAELMKEENKKAS